MSNWIYNEFKHCGVDYSDEKKTEEYDSLHLTFRNYEKEFEDMLDFSGLSNTQEMTLIDLGCGTGASTFFASKKFKEVIAVEFQSKYTVNFNNFMVRNNPFPSSLKNKTKS